MSAMNEYQEQWAATVVRTVAPNGQVFVDNHADRSIEVRLDDGYYHRASLDQAVDQITAALRLAVSDRFKAYRQMLRTVSGLSFEAPERGRRGHADEARRQAEQLAIEGASDDGTVRVHAVGLQHIALFVDTGLWQSGDRARLEANLSTACTRAVEAQFVGMHDIKHKAAHARH